MRINEIVVESDDLSEGPGWDAVKAGSKQIGQGAAQVGKGVVQGIPGALGGAASGVGAIAGGTVGAWNKMKQGFQSGKSAVSGTPNPNGSGSAGTPTTNQRGQTNAPQSNATPAQNPVAIRSQIRQLQQQMTSLQGQLRTASTPGGQQTPPAAGANAMNNMAGQLAPGANTTPSNSGGSTTLGQGSTTHAANATNPNAQQAAAGANAFGNMSQTLGTGNAAPQQPGFLQTRYNGGRTPTPESIQYYSKFLGRNI